MFKLYNIVWHAVSRKLHASQIPVGPARTRWGRCSKDVYNQKYFCFCFFAAAARP